MADFKIPPISTLAGTTFHNYLKVLRHQKIEPKYYLKTVLTSIIISIATPFHLYEKIKFNKKVKNYQFEKPPIFILGHWRSGTTHLHNLLCQADDAGFISTYNSVFPNNLASKSVFQNFMKLNMPDKRPSDNVKLNVNFPQEDEFAMGNLCPHSYYHFFYFPENYKEYYRQYVKFENTPSSIIDDWKKNYRKMIIKANLNIKGSRAIIKNPVNTGRSNLLLEEFPDAKFIHILRNPYIVYLSTKKFFIELMPTLWFHEVSTDFIENMVIDIYIELYRDFLKNKHQFTKDNFIEIRFEDFESDPLDHLESIYKTLNLGDFNKQKPLFVSYLSDQKGYKKNRYKISSREAELISNKWSEFLTHFDYKLPEEIEIT